VDIRPGLMPKARKDRLIIKELPDETLVYDLDTDKAHCLNETAALVLKHCDGGKTVDDLALLMKDYTTVGGDPTIVWLALEELNKAKLLVDVPSKPAHLSQVSRRQVIKTLGVAAASLPIVISIISPTPAQAASPCNSGDPCTSPADCCNAHPTCVTTGTPAGRGCRP
jgi:hypothetical protein